MANYDTVKAAIVGRLNALGYAESSQAVEFEHAAASEYANRYILKCLTGENQNDIIIDRFSDLQEWQVLIAFERSEQNDIVQYDKMHRAKDLIIKDIDKPSNWTDIAKIIKYMKWEVVETPNYYILDIRLSILDEYVHG